MTAPRPEAAPAGRRDARSTLLDMILVSEEGAPELELMLAAIETGLPGFAQAAVEKADQRRVRMDRERREREAERVEQERVREEETEARWAEKADAWQNWLDTGGRDEIAAWQPTTEVPEACDGCWWAIDRSGNVMGVGQTTTEAHRAANRWSLETLADPEAAAHVSDLKKTNGDPMSAFLYEPAREGGGGNPLRFLYVTGSEPGLAREVGCLLERTVL